jgi:hypothetical protein
VTSVEVEFIFIIGRIFHNLYSLLCYRYNLFILISYLSPSIAPKNSHHYWLGPKPEVIHWDFTFSVNPYSSFSYKSCKDAYTIIKKIVIVWRAILDLREMIHVVRVLLRRLGVPSIKWMGLGENKDTRFIFWSLICQFSLKNLMEQGL